MVGELDISTLTMKFSAYANVGILPDNNTNIQRINKLFRKSLGSTYRQIWFDTNSKYSCVYANVEISSEYEIGEVRCYSFVA